MLPPGNRAGHIVCKVSSLLHRGLKYLAANGITLLAGYRLYGTLGELAAYGAGQPAGGEGSTAEGMGTACMEGASMETSAFRNVF